MKFSLVAQEHSPPRTQIGTKALGTSFVYLRVLRGKSLFAGFHPAIPSHPCGEDAEKSIIIEKESETMSSTAISTVTKMIEILPERTQDQVVEHLREYLEEVQDELHWDALFKKTQPQLVSAARRARQEIAQGLAKPMDFEQL